ncbi:hypothetical protein A9D46_12710 [Photobacterium damselae subsp. damselae]|uniref:DUF302 domain-containing protein n=1 Tax=Photobacterium damselae TaxID=38293 RepID=UPI00084A317D|nr:DUF302 domain-containing protein [Photobacterium damselae]OEC83122.1 hypothetical protein A9D46_12710 [Photobacterium damselae subsp. damselae]
MSYQLESIKSAFTLTSNGMYKISSSLAVNLVADRIEQELLAQDMVIFNRIDHAKGALKIGLVMAPTELIIFGNPKMGSLLMRDNPTIAIDLPQKILITEEESKTYIYFNDPQFIAKRHALMGEEKAITHIHQVLVTSIYNAIAQ